MKDSREKRRAFSWPALGGTTAQEAQEAPARHSPAPTLKHSTHTPYTSHLTLDKHPTHILWQRSLILNPQKPALSTHPSKLWNSLRNVRIEGMKHLVFVLYWLGLRDSVKHSLQALTYTSINNNESIMSFTGQ